MSTITVARKNRQVAVACDTLTSWGSTKDSADYVTNSSKIIRIADTYIGISGPTSAKLILSDYFAELDCEGSFCDVASIFRTWRNLHAALKENYFVNPVEDEGDAFESSRIEALIANSHGAFGVFAHRAVQEFSRFSACGSGSEYALGAMYAIYSDQGKTAEDVARIGVQAAAEFDSGTGLPVISYSLPLKEPDAKGNGSTVNPKTDPKKRSARRPGR
jgi:ATP-dependent HslUV protease subunit HslV